MVKRGKPVDIKSVFDAFKEFTQDKYLAYELTVSDDESGMITALSVEKPIIEFKSFSDAVLKILTYEEQSK